MKILSKKTFREIWTHKFRSISIITVVAFTVGLLAGLRAGYPVLFNTYELNLTHYNVADGTFSFSEPIEANNVTEISNNLSFMEENNISFIEGRILYFTEVVFKGEIFQSIVLGINYPNEINQLVIEQQAEGITNTSQIFESNSSCLLDTHFAGGLFGHDVKLGDQMEVKFPNMQLNLTIQGIAQDSYYTYMVDPASKMPLLGNLAAIWINLEYAQDYIYNGSSLVNQVLFSVEDKLNKNQILAAADSLSYYFGSQNIPASSMKFVIYDESDEYTFFLGDAGSLDKMGTVFGIIGLIICVVIIFNTLNKMIYSQRKNIGLFLAMGSPKRKILLHYINITLILTLLGIIFGIPLAYGLAIGMAYLVTGQLYGFHQLDLSLPTDEFVYAGVITLGVCVICAILSAWTITTVTPREAMTATFTRIKKANKTLAERIFGWIPGFKSIYMLVPLREVFLKKKKSLITILALITSMIFLINSLAMVYNIFHVMTLNFDEYNTYDVQVILENQYPVTYVNKILNNESIEAFQNINHHEIFIDVYTKIISNGKLLSWTELACYQENSTLRSFNVIKGKLERKSDLTNTSVLLGNSIASKYDLKLDDQIEVGILANYTVEIVGLVGEFIDYSVLWTYEALQDSGASFYFGLLPNRVNGVMFTVDKNTNLKTLKDIFEEYFNISFWIESNTARKASLAMMEAFLGIMIIFLGVGILIGVLFSFQSMYVTFMDRQQDFLAFKATGTKKKYIRRMIFWENAILNFVSLILTIPIAYLTFWWTMEYITGGRFYIPTTIPWFTWPFVFLISLFTLWLATARMLRKIKKMNLADELRQTGIT